ncbi:hypothetical protein GCM10022234_08230 [Aeromicrobium panaciterrae]|uniref:Flp family type IVb pilin n=1 Tax=Aeromicrobium panaciterrae TaxID=363861 RepID=UPI0031E2EDC5
MAHLKLDLTASAPKDERGATATEYGLLVGFIALAIVLGVTAFGTALNGFFNDLAGAVAALVF